MRYGILGTTQAHHDDGTPVALGGARLRALLAALALRPGRVRPADALIAEVWDEGAGSGSGTPRDATGALQALIGRLRRAIGRTAIVSAEGGYLLRAEPDAIDLYRFERLARDGSHALAAGDPALAAELLDEALALWRGPALADLPGHPALAARAEGRQLDARRDRARADLARGHAAHALPALTELCGAHPLDEPLHALRLRALRDAGRAAEALAEYERVRRELADRLGTDPGPELRALHAELLTPAPTTPEPPRTRAPSPPRPPLAGPPPASETPAHHNPPGPAGTPSGHGDVSGFGELSPRGDLSGSGDVPGRGDLSGSGDVPGQGTPSDSGDVSGFCAPLGCDSAFGAEGADDGSAGAGGSRGAGGTPGAGGGPGTDGGPGAAGAAGRWGGRGGDVPPARVDRAGRARPARREGRTGRDDRAGYGPATGPDRVPHPAGDRSGRPDHAPEHDPAAGPDGSGRAGDGAGAGRGAGGDGSVGAGRGAGGDRAGWADGSEYAGDGVGVDRDAGANRAAETGRAAGPGHAGGADDATRGGHAVEADRAARADPGAGTDRDTGSARPGGVPRGTWTGHGVGADRGAEPAQIAWPDDLARAGDDAAAGPADGAGRGAGGDRIGWADGSGQGGDGVRGDRTAGADRGAGFGPSAGGESGADRAGWPGGSGWAGDGVEADGADRGAGGDRAGWADGVAPADQGAGAGQGGWADQVAEAGYGVGADQGANGDRAAWAERGVVSDGARPDHVASPGDAAGAGHGTGPERADQAGRAAPAVGGVPADGLGPWAAGPGVPVPALSEVPYPEVPYPAAPARPLAARSGAAPAPVPPVGNLHAALTSFVGRERDLRALRADLAAYRLITLLGPGGSGKTRLSTVAAASVAGEWPDGVWLAELAPAHDPATVVETVLTALGARETVIRGTAAEGLRAASDPTALDSLARLTEHCAARRMLLVLDNCEHVIEVAAQLTETLLAHCPGVSVLATSREPLAVPGELVRPVEPLPQPVALRLLADRGASARPGFRVEDDLEACAEICRRLDGLPLAIELAAARLRLLSPRQLADRLDDRFRLLTTGSRTLLPRQQTLRAVVDWSWDLLDERERAVLRRLSVFAGGCDLASAETVCADVPDPAGTPATPGGRAAGTGAQRAVVDPRDVAALLGSLVDKSLVVAAPVEATGPGVEDVDQLPAPPPSAGPGPLPRGAPPTGGGLPPDPALDGAMRYRLLETVAEYAAERLDEAGERAAVERRHLVAYRELARLADPLLRGAAQGRWLWRLELEHENLRTALRRAVAAADEQEALCLVLSLNWFWHLRGHRVDLRTWAVAAAELGPNPFLPPVVPAPPLADRATDAPPPMPPEQLWEARRGVRLLRLAILEGDLYGLEEPAVQRELAGVAAVYRPGLPQTSRLPGLLWFIAPLIAGDSDRLRELVDAAVRVGREAGEPWELAFLLQLRAKVLAARHSDPTSLDRDIGESLAIFQRLGDAWGAAEALSGRGEAREGRGEYAAAADDYRQAIGYAERLGAQTQVWLLRARLAGLLVERAASAREAEQGVRVLTEIMAAGQRMSSEAISYARLHYAVWCAEQGAFTDARAQFERQLADFGSRSHELFQGIMEGLLGWLDTLEGRPAQALARIRTALDKTQSAVTWLIAPQVPIAQLATGARALTQLGGTDRARTAARLLGAHDALFPPGVQPTRVHRTERSEAERAARSLLAGEVYERAYATGRGLALAEAAALI
ncbi:BTAD domain-containing putative transcriptional regulator [Streptomyces sp. NPDC057702]|uniref:BTAD domain-containing putative transcriptional regulator n=1 Tax=unclassified Streptomyces TaxID=2593676 RepID=UPI0036AD7E9A